MDGRDPIQAAGLRWCRKCRAEAWPTDATWLGADLVLVTFERLCEHEPHPFTMAISPSQLEDLSDRCAGTTRAGTRCRAWPRPGRAYCCQHDQRHRQEAER